MTQPTATPQMPRPQMGQPTPVAPRPVAAAPMPTPMPMPVQRAPQPGHMVAPQAMPTPQPLQQVHAPQAHAPQAQMPQVQAPQPGYPQPQVPLQAAPGMMPPVAQAATQAAVPQQPMPPQLSAPEPSLPLGAAPLDEELSREGGEKALPSISVHAFCDRQETAHCINETTRDWRMKRTNVKIYMGGLSAAIEFYHKENTPSLILIESGMRGPELFNQLEQLASVCDEGTRVILIGAANDIRLYRQLMDKGVSDYLVPPLHPLHVIRAMGELYADPDQPFVGRVAAFFGSNGGVGSSVLAHNTAWVLSELLHQETALVDMDTSFGTTGLDFAYDNTSGLEEALAEPDRLDETLMDRIMIRHTAKLSILTTAGSLNTKPVMSSDAYEAVVNAVRAISPLSILDMPHYWSDWTTNVLTSVDDVVITATPDLASLRNTKNLIEFLKSQRPNDPDPVLILNKTGMSAKTEIDVKQFAANVGLEPSLVLGWDPESHFEATNDGKMLSDVKTAETAVQGLRYIGNRLRTGTFDAPLKGAADTPSKKSILSLGKGKPKAEGESDSKSMFSFLNKKKG